MNLCVCTDDSVFLRRFEGYISAKEGCPFIVRSFMDYEKAIEFSKSGKCIFLVSADMATGDEMPKSSVFILHKGLIPEKLKGYRGLCIYERYSEIYEKLLDEYRELTDGMVSFESSRSSYKSSLVGIFSPDRRINSTDYAEKLVDKSGLKRFLYLDFDNFPGMESSSEGLPDLILYSLGKRSDIEGLIERMKLTKNGMDVVPPSDDISGIVNAGEDSIRRLLNELKERSGYEKIVCHFAAFPPLGVMAELEKIYVIWRNDSKGIVSLQRFERFLKLAGGEDVFGKIIKVNE